MSNTIQPTQSFTIQKTVRYSTFGNFETAENFWVVLHGYGQLTRYFIRKFQGLDPEKNFVLAPEGFHRFYLEGTSGRVGASWMTKEAREDDIADNMEYLSQLSQQFLVQKTFKKRILLGFSQGGATAARWHCFENFKAHHFILWASVFPEDIPFESLIPGMKNSINHFVVGDEDPYFSNEKLHQLEVHFTTQQYVFNFVHFKGKHTIDRETLLELEKGISGDE